MVEPWEIRIVEPCKEALQVLERLVLHMMCHSTSNTCWYYHSTTLPECVCDRLSMGEGGCTEGGITGGDWVGGGPIRR